MSNNDVCAVDVEIQDTPGVDAEISEKEHIEVEVQQISEGTGGGGNPYAVLYVEQSLTEEQMAQARKNIGAAGGELGQLAYKDKVSATDLDVALSTLINEAVPEEEFNEYQGAVSEALALRDENIDDNKLKIETLIGSDINKSVRIIANEELAKQLIADGADASLDTLTEIAAWIQEHPDDAAAMNAAIVELQYRLIGIAAGNGAVKKYVDDSVGVLGKQVGDLAEMVDSFNSDLSDLTKEQNVIKDRLDKVENNPSGGDGFSPVATVQQTEGGAVITITDKTGTTTATVTNGEDGKTPVKGIDYFDGVDGKDGYTPVKGIDYFDGNDGQPGEKGEKGDPGDAGHTPIKGTDYFTDADKAEMVAAVIATLPNAEGVGF